MAYIGNTATTQAFTPAVDYFNGDGSTVAFTLSKPVASVAQVQAVIENVPQNPGSAYTVSGNTITFTSAPPSGTANIYVYYTSPITQVIAPSQGTVGSSQLQSNLALTGSLTVDGTTLVVDDTNNRVGIGTASPSNPLTVRTSGTSTSVGGNIAARIESNGSGYASTLQFSDNVANSSYISMVGSATVFGQAGTERLRILAGGGITFNGDTAAANALDDYEEGTWTPTDVSGAGLSFSTAVGTYTKIGRMIYASTQIVYPSTANGSSALIGGLPFTLPATNVVRQGFISYANASVVARALPEDGQTRFDIRKTDGTNVTNSELSGKTLFAMLIYYV